jgi:hypothetical protein
MHGGLSCGVKEKEMGAWSRYLWPWSVVLSTVITRGAAVARLRTSKRRATAASAAGSSPTRQTGGRCTGARETAGSSQKRPSAPPAGPYSRRQTTPIPQAARSAEAICEPGTDSAALELLYGISGALMREAKEAHVDATRDELETLCEFMSGTIDAIEGTA